jgi:hypothetical protein
MTFSLIMDAVISALLIATICFAIKLNGRLAALRRDSERLQGLIRDLQGASGAAEEAVAGLKLTAGDAGRTLQNTIDGARTLEADLRFITERADETANRLEAGLRMHRDQQAAAPTAPAAAAALTPQQTASADKTNQSRLAMLLKQAEAEVPTGRNEPSLDPRRAKARDAREAAAPGPGIREPRRAAPQPVEPREAETEPQSRAERDLLRALEARSRQ